MITIHYADGYCHGSFDTHAKAGLVADRIRDLPGVELVEPEPVTMTDLEAVHSRRYLSAMCTGDPEHLAWSNGFEWSEDLLRGTLLTTGGAVAAARQAYMTGGISGSLSSGLHHASWDQGNGYCTFNGLALGALEARRLGADRVLILDLDAHCGGGTADIIRRHRGIEQVDVSVIGFDHYTSDDIARLTLSGGSEYLDVVGEAIAAIDDPAGIDLVVYNAGMDAHEAAGGADGITTDVIVARERLVFDWASRWNLPVAFVLAGGYRTGRFDLDDVADLHARTVLAALGERTRTLGV